MVLFQLMNLAEHTQVSQHKKKSAAARGKQVHEDREEQPHPPRDTHTDAKRRL